MGGVIVLAIAIGLAANIIIGAFMNQTQMLEAIKLIRIWHVVVPFLCYLAWLCIDAFRLCLILRQCGYKIHPWESFYNAVLGQFISNLTPSAAGGQPFQIHHLQTIGVPAKTATNIILSRFVVNAMLLMLILVVSIPVLSSIAQRFTAGSIVMYMGLASTFMFSCLFLIVLVRPQLVSAFASLVSRTFIGKIVVKLSKNEHWAVELREWIHGLRDEIHFLWKQKLPFMLADIVLNALAIVIQGLSMYYVLVFITGADLTWLQVLVVFVVVWQVIFYIPTPGASGSLEGGFAAVYGGLTGKPELALAAVFVWRFATYYLHVFLGAILFGFYGRMKKMQVTVTIPAIEDSRVSDLGE